MAFTAAEKQKRYRARLRERLDLADRIIAGAHSVPEKETTMLKIDVNTTVEREPLDTRVPPHVRIINGALDEDPNSPGVIILQGRIDPNTLRFLKVDHSYQRPLADRKDIYEALKSGTVVPNIEVGVRGQDFICDGPDYVIRSPAYIIDGWQRVGTAQQVLEQNPSHPIRIFASVHFATDEIWERHRFTALNKNVKKVSPNLHLRNMRDQNIAVAQLYGLTFNTREWPLYKRVSWSQNMARGELTTALTLAKAAMRLHAHHTSLMAGSATHVANGIAIAAAKVSTQTFRQNVCTFFKVVDECWGLREIEYRASAPQLKTSFLFQLARLFSSHLDFWDGAGRTLYVPADIRRKLAKFPLNDPTVRNLVGTGGAAANILYEMLVKHINSGKRTGHLRSRYARDA